jgi:hypothetical protein
VRPNAHEHARRLPPDDHRIAGHPLSSAVDQEAGETGSVESDLELLQPVHAHHPIARDGRRLENIAVGRHARAACAGVELPILERDLVRPALDRKAAWHVGLHETSLLVHPARKCRCTIGADAPRSHSIVVSGHPAASR